MRDWSIESEPIPSPSVSPIPEGDEPPVTLERCLASPQSISLHEAVRRGEFRAVEAWIWQGADVNLRDPSGAGTPLHFASASRVAFNQTRILAALLSAGADVNSVHANWRRTPLHYACYRGNTDAASQLIRASASVNPVDVGGHTPLHVAAYYGHYEIVKLLLSKGCNPDAETSRGRKAPVSAVTLALARGAAGVPDVARIIKLLSEHSPQARRNRLARCIETLLACSTPAEVQPNPPRSAFSRIGKALNNPTGLPPKPFTSFSPSLPETKIAPSLAIGRVPTIDIDLPCCVESIDDATALASALQRAGNSVILRHVNLCGCEIDSELALTVLDKVGSDHVKLDPAGRDFFSAAEQLRNLLACIRANDPTIVTLNLACSFSGEVGPILFLDALSSNNFVTSLNLQGCRLRTLAVERLVRIFKDPYGCLENANLALCLDASGVKALFMALKVNSTLKSLNICGANISSAATDALTDSLRVNNTLLVLKMDKKDEVSEELLALNQAARTVSSDAVSHRQVLVLEAAELGKFGLILPLLTAADASVSSKAVSPDRSAQCDSGRKVATESAASQSIPQTTIENDEKRPYRSTDQMFRNQAHLRDYDNVNLPIDEQIDQNATVIIPSLKTPLGQLAHSFVLGADPPEEEVLLALYRAYFEIDSTTVKMLTLDVTGNARRIFSRMAVSLGKDQTWSAPSGGSIVHLLIMAGVSGPLQRLEAEKLCSAVISELPSLRSVCDRLGRTADALAVEVGFMLK